MSEQTVIDEVTAVLLRRHPDWAGRGVDRQGRQLPVRRAPALTGAVVSC
jgi:hypothetical protein